MRLNRHTAAALASWLLLLPPVVDHRVGVGAPKSNWKVEAGFATEAECRANIQEQNTTSSRVERYMTVHPAPGPNGASDLAHQWEWADCLASDDPELKQK